MANTLRFKRGLVATIPTAAAGEPLFTTDTFDLYIGNGTGNTRFQKYIASGTTSQLLRGDGSLLTMPIVLTSPSNGQVLKYNGTSWVNDSDAGITGSGTTNYLPKFTGASTLGDSVIRETNGNIGIGINPSSWVNTVRALDFEGGVTLMSLKASPNLYLLSNAYFDTSWKYKTNGLANWYEHTSGKHVWHNAPSGTPNAALTWTAAMTLTANGRLLLGTTSEQTYRLAVAGDVKFDADAATNGFYWDNTNKRLGIGTTSPLVKLQVRTATNQNFRVSLGTNLEVQSVNDADSAYTPITFRASVFDFQIGSVGIGTTSPTEKLQVNGALRITGAITNNTTGGILAYQGSGNTLLGAWGVDAATRGLITFYLSNSTGTTGSEFMRLNSTGNLLIRTTTDTGEALQVNGTMKVTGASTFGGNMSLTLNQNAATQILVSNTTSGTGSRAELQLTSSNGTLVFGKYSATTTTYKTFSANDGTIYNGVNGNLSILNDVSGGSIILTAGASSTAHFTIASTGAATFSSSVTVGGNIIGNGTTNTYYQIAQGNFNHRFFTRTNVGAALERFTIEGGAVSGLAYFQNTDVGIGTITPAYKLDVIGEARVSNAIAIGTTPDTNKPFKILKSINGTVGINFENTSTGSLAFSAIQMGTDVTGGTKLTNLVYASSGITQSGVYHPDGTALINIGNGGLNLFGTPTRFYTGGSNGTLRLMLDNEGTTQYTATTPTTNATDGYKQYSADVVAGNAAPHFRTENGAVIKLYQETTGVSNAIFSQGGGNSVLDDSTFDGYTLRQIVKALRNQGILQ